MTAAIRSTCVPHVILNIAILTDYSSKQRILNQFETLSCSLDEIEGLRKNNLHKKNEAQVVVAFRTWEMRVASSHPAPGA